MKNLILKALHVMLFFGLFLLSGTIMAQSLKKFKSADIGNPALKGETHFLEPGVDVTAGGDDIWMNADQFHFVYEQFSGDFDCRVRLESLEKSHLYAKAGLMAREDLTPGSRHLYFLAFPNNDKRNKNRSGYEFQYRLQSDKESKAIYPSLTDTVAQAAYPISYPNGWIRLKRAGNNFSAFTSADGRSWKLYTDFLMEMPKKLYLGMAVTGHSKGKTTVARFRDFETIK